MLNEYEKYRYSRQINLPGISHDGQVRLKQARVLCIGVGGLGSPTTLYLAAAGVGCIGVVDYDLVEISNLPRQILFDESDIGQQKALVAKQKLQELNSAIQINCYPEKLNQQNALTLLTDYDLVIDGTDNFFCKYLINAAAIKLGKPMIFASVLGFEGRLTFFSQESGCYQCLYPNPPKAFIPNCAEHGVLGPLAGMLGCMQALEAIKYLSSYKPLSNRMLIIDALTMRVHTVNYEKNKHCEICSKPSKDILLPEDVHWGCQMLDEIDVLHVNSLAYDGVIDVRDEPDFIKGHISGAINLPLKNLGELVPTLLDQNKSYLVYCQQGIRSQQAIKLLKHLGFNKVTHLKQGYSAWCAQHNSST